MAAYRTCPCCGLRRRTSSHSCRTRAVARSRAARRRRLLRPANAYTNKTYAACAQYDRHSCRTWDTWACTSCLRSRALDRARTCGYCAAWRNAACQWARGARPSRRMQLVRLCSGPRHPPVRPSLRSRPPQRNSRRSGQWRVVIQTVKCIKMRQRNGHQPLPPRP